MVSRRKQPSLAPIATFYSAVKIKMTKMVAKTLGLSPEVSLSNHSIFELRTNSTKSTAWENKGLKSIEPTAQRQTR